MKQHTPCERRTVPLPAYTVRESQRATRVRLELSAERGLVVIVPSGFDQRDVPNLVYERRDWIEKTRQRIAARTQVTSLEPPGVLPQRILLQAIGETWQVRYQSDGGTSVTLRETGEGTLTLCGAIDAWATGTHVLKQWLTHKATRHLVPWLRAVSEETNLPFGKAQVRGQKTRWASCSGRKTISLNRKILFVPPDLVRYLFIHELCHTIHLNHSPSFWALVARKEPDYRRFDKELNQAMRYVPWWV